MAKVTKYFQVLQDGHVVATDLSAKAADDKIAALKSSHPDKFACKLEQKAKIKA